MAKTAAEWRCFLMERTSPDTSKTDDDGRKEKNPQSPNTNPQTMPDVRYPTNVVNVRYREPDVYIGRGIGSVWGNPFRRGPDMTKAQCINEYWTWLWSDDPQAKFVRSNVHKLAGKTLGCYCAPKACHGHLLAALADFAAAYPVLPVETKPQDLPQPKKARAAKKAAA